MNGTRVIRPGTPRDAAACAAIYAHYVANTPITFETEPPTADAMADRIEHAHLWLVLEDAGDVIGYAYAATFHPRAAYQWSCEVSVYLNHQRRSSGAGTALYEALLPALRDRGFRRAIACVTQPNPASNRLHDRFGFEPVGTYRKIGWKNGAWHDVAWSELDLTPDEDPAATPAPPE